MAKKSKKRVSKNPPNEEGEQEAGRNHEDSPKTDIGGQATPARATSSLQVIKNSIVKKTLKTTEIQNRSKKLIDIMLIKY